MVVRLLKDYCVTRTLITGVSVATKSCIFVQKPTREKQKWKEQIKYIYQQAASIQDLKRKQIVSAVNSDVW